MSLHPFSQRAMISLSIGLVFFLAVSVDGRSFRVGLIPNGDKFSCGNCHIFPGGPRNPFGQAVEQLVTPGSTVEFWGTALAALDSDGDGVSNGLELQDPDGVWRPGDPAPGILALVTNPGDAASVPQQTPTPTPRPALPPDLFVAQLSGTKVNPPVETAAEGLAVFRLDETRTRLEYWLYVFDLEGVTASHIHLGLADENGPVVHPLETPVSGKSTGLVTLSQEDVDNLYQGRLYVNVHTTLNPAGEIRGQILFGAKIPDPIPSRIPKGTIVIELEPVFQGLVAPLGVVSPDDGSGRLFVYDQVGVVKVAVGGVLLETPFLDVRDRLVPLGIAGAGSFDERGLLGFAFHPDFAANPKVYIYTSEPVTGTADFTTDIPPDRTFDHQSVIAEWTVDPSDPNRVAPSSRREILRIDEPQFNHNAGTLRFGPDGYLYVAVGDGGGADDADGQDFRGAPIVGHSDDGNGQNKENVYGTILRIDVDGRDSSNGNYGLPPDNPFVGAAGLDEIFAYGFRNPYSFSFDMETGELYVGDVGQNDVEEIDIVKRGGNYGWRLKEGSFFFDPNGPERGFVTTAPVAPLPQDLIDPIAEYDHDDGLSVIGGYVYRGRAIPPLRGRYVTGDFGTFAEPAGRLFYLDETERLVEFVIGADDRPLGLWLKGFGQDGEGEIYVCGSRELGPFGTTGQVLKIVPFSTSIQSWTAY